MAPRTRQARKARNLSHTLTGLNNASLGDSTHASVVDQVGVEGQPITNPTHPQNSVIGKRTLSALEDSPVTSTGLPEGGPTPIKRARPKAQIASVNTPSRLVQLMTAGEDTTKQLPAGRQKVDEGKQGRVLQRKSSFYPGLNGVNSILDVQTDNLADSIPDEAHFEDENDWIDNQCYAAGLFRGRPTKFSEAIANERPTWTELPSISGPCELTFPNDTLQQGCGGADTSFGQGASTVPTSQSATETVVPAEISGLSPPTTHHAQDGVTLQLPPKSPSETDLRFVPGTTRILLNSQQPLVNMVIVEAIDNMRASLLFYNAFPDTACATEFVREALITAAMKQNTAAAILKRLQEDESYFSTIVPLPRARISIFRAEVKERCNAITAAEFLAMSSPAEVAKVVQDQLSQYNYIFPRALHSRVAGGLVVRSRPYRNTRIISVIRDLYFTGGYMSFARRFHYLFPGIELSEDETGFEVPIPMVALVATALYAVLYEWRTGKQQVADFSANSYLDVYQGHVNSMKQIEVQRSAAFHSMMADIYSKASAVPSTAAPSGGPSGAINFEELEA